MLKDESNIFRLDSEKYDLFYFGFIQSLPKCDNQLFHIDYFDKTITYFIPMIELTDLNGTEYVEFNNYSNSLLDISNKYLYKKDIINYLSNITPFSLKNGTLF